MSDNSFLSEDIPSDPFRMHRPVLVKETVDLLQCKDEGVYVDCTLGMGGHATEILKASAPDGFLLGIDVDEDAIRCSEKRLEAFGRRFRIVREDYRMLNDILQKEALQNPDGILADLGPSLLQLTTPERGFSFQTDGPLDMRMDRREQRTAAKVVNTATYEELKSILRDFGEEKKAAQIAGKIVEARKTTPIQSTIQLRKLIETVVRRKHGQKIHPATRTFQALRIAVNRELENLDRFLMDGFDCLAGGGRLVVIAFHSLEDRIVKRVFQFLSASCRCPAHQPQCTCGGKPLATLLTPRPVRPGDEEVSENPAARSARLRAVEKLLGPTPRELWPAWLESHA